MVYDAGRVLRYDPSSQEDRHSGLGKASPYDFDDKWSDFKITKAEFESVWARTLSSSVLDCGI
ncbi:hypothetical protein [Actinoplanes sp. DH11]|uniref:hypothetical protein n=1 Tax=Actinoplanes sp. DH11 TaxID=2857011 RepID=UPI001E37117A|nr:hypothetical protein [Actinoplanes sp. DH11]